MSRTGRTLWTLIVMVSLLAGCTPDPDEREAPELGSVPPDPAWEHSPAESQWESLYRDWTRNGIPEELDWQELHEIQFRSLAESYRIMLGDELPDDVGFVRFVEADDKPAVTAQCLKSYGFESTVGSDGGVFPADVPADQTTALTAALYRCDVQYPVHPRFFLPPTVNQLEIYYRYYVDSLVPCLRAEDRDVPDPPTFQTFVGTYHTRDNWHPYDFVETRSPADHEALNQQCPPLPPWAGVYPND